MANSVTMGRANMAAADPDGNLLASDASIFSPQECLEARPQSEDSVAPILSPQKCLSNAQQVIDAADASGFSRPQLAELIASGTFAHVFATSNPEEVVKMLKVPASDTGTPLQFRSLGRELKLLRELSGCPYVAQCRGSFMLRGAVVAVTMGRASSNLRGYLRDTNLSKKPQLVERISAQLCAALCFMHGRHILHRDLKPLNVLVFPDPEVRVKVCDFDSSTVLSKSGLVSHRGNCTTVAYASPESLFQAAHLTAASDCWSLGCIIMELYLGRTLFASPPLSSQVTTIHEWTRVLGTPQRLDQWRSFLALPQIRGNRIADLLQETGARPRVPQLVGGLLRYDASHRLTATGALLHPSFAVEHVTLRYLRGRR